MKQYRPAILAYLAALGAILADWYLMLHALDLSYPNPVATAAKALGDAALLLLPFWLLPPKWRPALLVPIWLLPLLAIPNIAYFRFWHDLIPPAAVTMGGNVDSTLMQATLSLLRPSDLLWLLPTAAATAAVLLLRPRRSPSFTNRLKIRFVALSLLVGIAGQASYFKTAYSMRRDVAPLSLKEGAYLQLVGDPFTSLVYRYHYNGPLYYQIRYIIDAARVLGSSTTLSDSDRAEIDRFIERYATAKAPGLTETPVPLDSLNIIYVIVESLNADMVGREIAGRPVMPVLDSLSRLDGTVYFDNVVSQTKLSCSSDGHLLLMTGLLPPESISYSITCGSSNTFPSLADHLPRHTKALLLADDGLTWNEGPTLANFRLGHPVVKADRPQYPFEQYGQDGAMFLQAADMVRTLPRPFMMTLMTISMHIPFREEAWPLPAWLRDAPGLTPTERDYANVSHRFDRALGTFLSSLPPRTIVFIASDHHAPTLGQTAPQGAAGEPPARSSLRRGSALGQCAAQGAAGHPLPSQSSPRRGSAALPDRALFMAIHTSRTARISRTVGQINLYPATLDLLGILPAEGTYRGLAPSALDPAVDGTIDSYGQSHGPLTQGARDTLAEACRLSDLIIRADYFRP